MRLPNLTIGIVFAICLLATGPAPAQAEKVQAWSVHNLDRPQPPVITPGTASTPEQPGKAPSDAIVLFDSQDLSRWKPYSWKVKAS